MDGALHNLWSSVNLISMLKNEMGQAYGMNEGEEKYM
jgi:hypothetical protein